MDLKILFEILRNKADARIVLLLQTHSARIKWENVRLTIPSTFVSHPEQVQKCYGS